MKLRNLGSDKKFISVLSDGKLHQSVEDGTEGSLKRTYEDKEGNDQTKSEFVFDEVEGKITKVSFEDSDYGKNLKIEIDGDCVISLGTGLNFGEDIMKKLPSIDLAQMVVLTPYSFTDEKGKNRRGITVKQNGVKVKNFYYDEATKSPCNGYPVPSGDTTKYDSDDWKIYFMTARKFLINTTESLFSVAQPLDNF